TEQTSHCSLRVLKVIKDVLKTLQLCRQRRVLPRGKCGCPEMLPVDITHRRQLFLDVDTWRKARIEVCARHDAGQRLAATVTRHQVQQREPIFDEWDAKEWYAGLECMWYPVACKDVFKHFAVDIDMPDHNHDLVRRFAPLEQIGNLASYGLRLFVTS